NSYRDLSASATVPAIAATIMGDSSSTIGVSGPDRVAALTPMTSGAARYDGQQGLAWTADGRIVFTSVAGGQPDLWIAESDGRHARALTADPALEAEPSVTSDGRFVVFIGTKNGRAGIWRLSLE